MKYKVSVIGLFCTGKEVSDGQSIKTRIVTDELERFFGVENVNRIDTYGWRERPFGLFRKSISAVRDSDNVIFMTDDGGIKVFPWLLLLPNLFYKRGLHYVVIGGWLTSFLEKHKVLSACLKKFDNIFVETSSMNDGLKRLGFSNVCLLPNFKKLNLLKEEQLVLSHGEPYSFCTFSRVMKEKGIEDAVEAIKSINEKHCRTICTLDIYGAIDPQQKEWFNDMSQKFSSAIRYCGVVPFDKSVDTLKNYFALLFPTCYVKEGIPGTIIDAYSAGLPVIASRWSGFRDMIDENFTGIGYPWMENEHLTEIIEQVVTNSQIVLQMKNNCLKKARDFMPENVMKILVEKMF